MYLKRIEMHGFKSFADPVTIDFRDGITCIVGPNGSGKSNISDAIRWALGEQSPKTLRGGKMEEVIFAGTDTRKSRGMAEVVLVIDNSTNILPIEYNEVAITRRMYRSGENEYLINNNKCRLRDVRELIMDTGIGVDGYSLIGQGKISDIVSNKTESRREIFEEAAGIVLYKSRKSETERKLNSSNANLERINDIISEIEGRIDKLREDSQNAKRYLELKQLNTQLEINIILRNIDSFNKNELKFAEDIQTLEEQITGANRERDLLIIQLEEIKNECSNLDAISEESHALLLNKIQEISEVKGKYDINKENIQFLDKDESRIVSEIEVAKSKLDEKKARIEELTLSEREILSSYKEASAILEKEISIYNDYINKNAKSISDIDESKNLSFQYRSNLESNKQEIRNLENMIRTMEQRKAQIDVEQADVHGELEEVKKAVSILEDSIEENEKQFSTEKISLSNSTNDLLEKRQEEQEVRKDIEHIKITLSRHETRKKTIEEMESNYEGFSHGVRNLMNAKLPGVRGVITDLIQVGSGYELAIETALGGSIQSIVCDNDDVAKKSIRYLKDNRAGRLTFLPISSIRYSKTNIDSSLKSEKGFKCIATECITYDKEIKNIVTYLLGRVLIVENMDCAVSLSKKVQGGIRIVTLDGEVVNSSGAITGGKFKNASANLLERKAEINKLSTQIAELEVEKINKDNILAVLQGEISNVTIDVDKKNEFCNSLEIRLHQIRNEKNEREAKLISLHDDNKYELERVNLDEDLSNAKSEILKFETLIEELNKKIEEIGAEHEKLIGSADSYKENIEKQNEIVTTTKINVSNFENELNNLQSSKSLLIDDTTELERELESKSSEILQIQVKRDEIYKDNGNEDNINALIKNKEALEEEIRIISERRKDASNKLDKVSEEERSISNRFNSFTDQKYQIDLKRTKNTTQLENIKDRLFDEFEMSYAQALDLRIEEFVMSNATSENRKIKEELRELGSVNIGAIEEYDSTSKRYEFLTSEREDVVSAINGLAQIVKELDTEIKAKFKSNFDKVIVNFEQIFKELFGGGHAQLLLEDEDNPLESNIEIIAQPPGKKLQNINLLSGGEKSMTAIALMFAVLKVKPTPFCVLDEVEAALDDDNIERFANYLRNFKEVQFALVTHQKATMEYADVLYGVTMAEKGVSQLLSLKFNDKFDL